MSHVLVMGPGRSGSHYLCNMLRGFGFGAVHEETMNFRGKYGDNLEDCDWEGAAAWLKEKDMRALCGFPYGFMVYYLRHHVPDLRVICVHREKAEWLKAATKKGFAASMAKATSFPSGLVDMAQYWEVYSALMRSVAPPVLHLKMGDLGKECGHKVNRLCFEGEK